jgi:hypothetical protein
MSRAAISVAVFVGLALAAVPALAAGKQVRYVGIHPVPRSEGGGICYIEGPHVHVFDADKIQYRDHRGANYFVGDPVAYGYDGKRYVYKGHHPIHVSAVVGDDQPDDEYCYLNGPHYHYFAPPDDPEFKVAGDAYFYVGDPPPVYVEARPAMMKINAVYQPLSYERPVISVDAPDGWIGARAEFVAPAAAVVVAPPRADVIVAPPRASVTVQGLIPAPSLHIGVGIGIGSPGVIVHERGPAVIVHERPVIVHERPVIVHERPVIIHERPVIVHDRPVIHERAPVKHDNHRTVHDHR